MKLLELFSGTGSVGRPWREAGHEVISVDADGRFGAEIVEDLLRWNYCNLPWIPDAIWSSPPCVMYSRARTRAKTPRNFALADSLVAKAKEIIKYFQQINPDLIWFIENGNNTLLWDREVANDLTNFVVADYCQYSGPGCRKRTRIAHSDNLLWIPRPLCDSKTCSQCVHGRHILTAQRGPGKSAGVRSLADKCSLDTLHALPRELTEEILRVCEAHQWQLVSSSEQ